MNRKWNQILFGVILLLLGILALIVNTSNLDFKALTLLFVGLAFLLLYRTKRKIWSLIAGCYSVYAGLIMLLQQLGFRQVSALIGAMFFLVPGIIFLVLYYEKNRTGLIYPACILMCMGAFILFSSFSIFSFLGDGLFFMIVGLGCMMMRILGKETVPKVFGGLGLVVFIFGLGISFGAPLSGFFGMGTSQFVSIAIVCAGLFVIVKALLQKK